jgi:mono/diheme cytochrome c family protein
MLDQRRPDAFTASRQFADGQMIRLPPQGVVPYGSAADRDLREPVSGGAFRAHVPLKVDRALLERGRDRFEIFCAPCHGVAGDGESMVADAMRLRRPPSLVAPPVSDLAVGRVFQVMSIGYGLMPAYADELGDHDRWAVAAYVLALRRSRSATLAELAPEQRDRLSKESPR